MAKNENRNLTDAVKKADVDSFNGLKTLTTYSPAKTEFATDKLQAASDDMMSAQTAETQAVIALKNAHDNRVRTEWDFHNLVLGSKGQVVAQYGDDANEVQAVGLKKVSEYKSPKRKKKKKD